MHALLVEDDDRMALALGTALAQRGHTVRRVGRASDALQHAREAQFVLLDLGLPDLDGLELLRRLRTVCEAPLIVVTARCEERDIVQGLRAGADDYVVKPFRMTELMARIDAVRRRTGAPSGDGPTGGRVRTGDVEIDPAGRTVTVSGQHIRLTRREFDVLAFLAARPGEVHSREEILDRIWGDAFLAASRSLDVHVAGIRAKTARPGLVRTVRGFGYQLGATGQEDGR
ncbi:response regulator transcription factor [Streptomyces sioyaensis]|uniref:Response regulator transcription factor n=1 Tax=Streptomyces sioyaensis TaxID=67364 RepID=A0A4Q1QU18_9ACTN|nr:MULTISPECIES: response regulator transcription factor [Streptomyces]MBM4796449.1 response regulator transcription factor [Streptomyces sioyaensis]RXS66632.1 response regulator transcription factor [Streptomyces sioyaensis]RXS83698.1 response regulator transcription factor [Streptomyces sp. TM32]